MQFPKATVILVSAALVFVVWEQFRDRPAPVNSARFTDLSSNPAERSDVVDWVVAQIPALCEQSSGGEKESTAYSECVKRGESRTSTCRREIYDAFPGVIASESLFRDVSITMMNCLVPQSGLINP
ncbi:hypothetical protein MARLIPOL_02730 [Marinobacter lipolyticus SM19]|uniref:Uncharacterized protein n=1 Tax=Marinobacter lipolyticus SM19 TaxID=1318628 RepID=R8B4R1_9GAMM|nr:hypothetical protein [Marinobacter lipolyticus]EON93585.1 hypothetical protein MARLIPOL_02730 [Marinobacter lipolyticus SM19]